MAAELEPRWASALRELNTAQEAYDSTPGKATALPQLSPQRQSAVEAIGQQLPEVWHQETLSQAQKKARLRCLIDKVVVHRRQRDTVHTRIVWKGGEVTTMERPIHVHSWNELSTSDALAQHILDLHHQGLDDETIAPRLTAQGYRSPLDTTRLLTNTVKCLRLKHQAFVTRSQSHPRRMPGYLTVPQVAVVLDCSPHWFYYYIKKGAIVISRNQTTGLYLLPDTPETMAPLRALQAGHINRLCLKTRFENESHRANAAQTPAKDDKIRYFQPRCRGIDRSIKMQDRSIH